MKTEFMEIRDLPAVDFPDLELAYEDFVRQIAMYRDIHSLAHELFTLTKDLEITCIMEEEVFWAWTEKGTVSHQAVTSTLSFFEPYCAVQPNSFVKL